MDTNEALRRIFVRHARILIVFTLIGLMGAVALGAMQQPTYTATARVSLGGWDPQDVAKAKTLADSARAIATSDVVVRRALSDIPGDRDVGAVADSIVVSAVGSSTVVDISASDEDPRTAATIANGIALALIDVRSTMLRGGVQSLLEDLDRRVAEMDEKVAQLKAAARAAQPNGQAAEIALQEYAAAVRARAELDVDRRQIVQIGAAQPRAAVLDSANVPDSASGTPAALRLMLGIVAGLLAGLAIAASLEVLRPTVMGTDGIAQAAGAPWLGTVATADRDETEEGLETARRSVVLAASRADVRSILLVPVDVDEAEADRLARSLQVSGTALPGPVPGSRVAVVDHSAPQDGGIVAIVPEALARRDLSTVHHIAAASGWPILGFLILEKPSRRRARRSRSAVFEAGAAAAAEPRDGFDEYHEAQDGFDEYHEAQDEFDEHAGTISLAPMEAPPEAYVPRRGEPAGGNGDGTF